MKTYIIKETIRETIMESLHNHGNYTGILFMENLHNQGNNTGILFMENLHNRGKL